MENISAHEQLDWSEERLIPAFQRPERLMAYDLGNASREIQVSVEGLAGLLNRPRPQIYLLWRKNDAFWLSEALAAIPYTLSPLRDAAILQDLLSTYSGVVKGLVIYDPAQPDTINIATMLAGLHDALIVSPAQAEAFQQVPYAFPILTDLRTYAWRNRLQIYQWAYENLLPLCSKHLVAGMDPAIAVGVRSFLVATKTFIYWLNPLDLLPRPLQGWQCERSLMRKILRAFRSSAVHLGWFVQEGSGVTLTSEQAIPVACTDYFSNLETWTAISSEIAVPAVTTYPDASRAEKKVYLSFTFSEGDNLQYLQQRMLDIWRQPERGDIPLGWPISLLLPQAAPALLSYYRRTASAKDEFIAAPSGVGYLYPSKWPASKRRRYLEQTGRLMQQMQVQFLQVLDSNYWLHPLLMYRAIRTGAGLVMIERALQQQVAQILRQFGAKGILSGGGLTQVSWSFHAGLPIFQNLGTAKSVQEAVAMIRHATPTVRPYFINLYLLAWNLGPTEVKQIVAQLGEEYEVVTPGRLLALLPAEEN